MPRPGFEGGKWGFKLADSDMVFTVAAEDKGANFIASGKYISYVDLADETNIADRYGLSISNLSIMS